MQYNYVYMDNYVSMIMTQYFFVAQYGFENSGRIFYVLGLIAIVFKCGRIFFKPSFQKRKILSRDSKKARTRLQFLNFFAILQRNHTLCEISVFGKIHVVCIIWQNKFKKY